MCRISSLDSTFLRKMAFWLSVMWQTRAKHWAVDLLGKICLIREKGRVWTSTSVGLIYTKCIKQGGSFQIHKFHVMSLGPLGYKAWPGFHRYNCDVVNFCYTNHPSQPSITISSVWLCNSLLCWRSWNLHAGDLTLTLHLVIYFVIVLYIHICNLSRDCRCELAFAMICYSASNGDIHVNCPFLNTVYEYYYY